MILAHLTDLHVGEAGAGAHNADRLAKIAGHLQARALAGEQLTLILTGDITDDGQAWQWEAVTRALAPLVGLVPLLMVPGNHDCGMMGVTWDDARAERSAAAIDALCVTPWHRKDGLRVWQVGNYNIVGMDSCIGNADDLFPPLARGEIGREQMMALELHLQDEVPTVVALHHHPLWQDWGHALEDSDALLHLLDRRDHVHYVLYGHRHVEARTLRAGTDYLAGGKATEVKGGMLRWREIDLETGQVMRREITA